MWGEGKQWLAATLVKGGDSNGANAEVFSYLYRWEAKGSRFVFYQGFPTINARGVEFFEIDEVGFLAVANSAGGRYPHKGTVSFVDSTIFRWDDDASRFVEYQKIATSGAKSFRYFEIEKVHYLFVANSKEEATERDWYQNEVRQRQNAFRICNLQCC